MIKNVDEKTNKMERFPIENRDQVSINAIFATLMLYADLVKQDFTSHPKSLENFFGGGYEIVMLINGRFQKFTDYLFVVWIIRSNSFSISIIIKNNYQDQILIIRSLEGNGTDFNRNRGYLVFPKQDINESKNFQKILIKKPDLNSKFLINYFLMEDSKKPQVGSYKEVFHAIFCQTDAKEYLSITESDDYINIIPSKIFRDEIESKLREYNVFPNRK